MRYVFVVLAALAALSACGKKDAEQPEAGSTVPAKNVGFDYTCADGTKFNARIDRGNVILTLDGQEHTLPPDVNTSGAHYAAENLTFIAQGKEATFIRLGESVRHCQTP